LTELAGDTDTSIRTKSVTIHPTDEIAIATNTTTYVQHLETRPWRPTDTLRLVTVTLLSVTVFVATGCRTTQQTWNQRALRAEALHSDRELDRAEEKYRTLLDEASPESRDARSIHRRLAELELDRDRPETAIEHLQRAWRGHDDEVAASAHFRTGEVHDAWLDQSERAESLWFDVLAGYPNSATAEKTAEMLARRFAKRRRPEAFASRAEEIHDAIADGMVADNLMFWVARGYQLAHDSARTSDATPAAEQWYRRLLRRHPQSSMADDAHWELAQLYESRQSWRRATDHYRSLAQMYRPSWLVGSYSSPYASRSRYRLGLIHLLFTDDYSAATDQFNQYLQDFPTLRYADDSAWHLAHIERLRRNPGDYRQKLRRFIDDYPQSRYIPRAKSILAGDSDSTVTSRRD